MFEELDAAIATIESLVRDFEPGLLDARGAVRAVKRFTRAKHVCEAGLALAAKRVDETGAYRETSRSAAEWAARTTGTNLAAAERLLDTADALAEAPQTAAAFRAGRVSAEQAHEITNAVRKDPAAESSLLNEVKSGISMKGLKDECRRIRARAEADDAAWADRLHANRQLRRWVDGDSAPCGMYRLSPDKGAEINAALDAEIDLIFQEARANGEERESREAYAADALHALITRGPRKATSASLIIDGTIITNGTGGTTTATTIDIGQRCELVGVGPIPVTLAKQMLSDAKIRAVPADPTLLPDYTSDSRYLPQWMRDWLDQHYPVCGQPGCDASRFLQYDHVVALADGGQTTLDNLWRLCTFHHRQKTLGRLIVDGVPHHWRLVPPHPTPDTGPDPP